MSDDTSNADLWKALGRMEGRQDGSEKRLDQQHQDILRLTAAMEDHKTMMLRCFAEQEQRTNTAIEKSINGLAESMTDKLRLVAQQAAEHVLEHTVNGPMKIDEFIHNRPKTALALSGIVAAILTKMAVIWGIIPAV